MECVDTSADHRGDEAAPGIRNAVGIDKRGTDRRIASLAIPALGALLAEPLFLAVDSALIGHLGAAPLAGLAIASSILQTAVGLMIFLAYSTTPLVARRRGAGRHREAVQAGIDGLWLAVGLGTVLAVILWALSGPLARSFDASEPVVDQAVTYLAISCLGLPAMLLVFAAMGLLRGLQDTRTPLAVAGIGFAINGLLNWWFIYGLGWGIAGSAWGTVIAQWGMVAVYLLVIARHAVAHGANPWPQRSGLSSAGRSGWWLFIRTIGLRAAMLVTVFAAASHGTEATAGFQVVFTVFSTIAFSLDALAIAAQALVGDALGAGRAEQARWVVRRTVFWGVACGTGLGVILLASCTVVGRIFTSDPAVLQLVPPALMVVALALPVCGIVFVLDGVLMGAGDAPYLAWTSLVNLAVYLPLLWAATTLTPTGVDAILTLTIAYAIGFMLARATTLGLRARGGRWIRLGV